MELNSVDVKELLINISNMFEAKKEELSKYDSVIGDGDHGFSMARGAKAAKSAIEALNQNVSANDYFKAYSRAFIKEIGGAIGPLFGLFFSELGKATVNSGVLGTVEFSEGIQNATKKVMDFGGAKVGDKTMVDSMVPASNAVKNIENRTFEQVAEDCLNEAYVGLQSTISLMAKRGRSHFLQEKSVGYQDAGATSFYFVMKTIRDFVVKKGELNEKNN